MENNEDNRQMTVIAEAIQLIKDRAVDEKNKGDAEYEDGYYRSHEKTYAFMNGLLSATKILESLLSKEKEQIIDARGFTGKEFAEQWFDQYYNQTFKTT